jgi:hypothetical protein
VRVVEQEVLVLSAEGLPFCAVGDDDGRPARTGDRPQLERRGKAGSAAAGEAARGDLVEERGPSAVRRGSNLGERR